MYNYLKLLLQKVSGTVILHASSNNCVNETSVNALDNILKFKQFIKKIVLDSKIIISNIMERLDNGKAALRVKRLNEHLCSLEIDIVDNANIGKES